MRLAACIPVLLAGASLSAAHLTQLPWHSQPYSQSTTILDALNEDPDYTSLIVLLQRARLIPTLNKLQNATLFAPTNDAIKRHSSTNSLWDLARHDTLTFTDNVREELRQQLFYHILNYSIPDIPNEPDMVAVHKSLHYPRKPIDPPTKQPPPWLPVPGGTLNGEPQRLRVSARDHSLWVGTDSFGKGGTGIIKGRKETGNGVVLGIDDVLEPPSDLARVVSEQNSVSYFQRILTPDIARSLNDTPGLTLFLPVDSAWDALASYERLYLESEYASDDLVRIFEMHAAVENHVRYSDEFDTGRTIKTLDGRKLEIVTEDGKTKISDASLVQPDIYASNGVLHLVSSLLIPEGALKLTPEKYLLTLNCTQFVSFLNSVDLKSLINDTDAKYTILAPQDDVFSVFGDGDLPEKGTPELKSLLQYHFIPGKWTANKLGDGMLLETELKEEGLDNGRQVLGVQVTTSDNKKSTNSEKSIRFAGASVIGQQVEVNNSIIYFISRPIVPPVEPLGAALPTLELSSFLAAVFSTAQADTLRTTPRTSLLIPRNQAFKRLGELVSAHLLSATPKGDLENVILHHALNSVEYAQSLQNGSQHTFPTLEGSDLKVERLKNGTVFIAPSGGWADMKAELFPRDLLTKTGVVHELSDILIPRSVDLTIGKLMKAAKGSTMATLVNKAGFEWILNGTAPPEGSQWADEKLSKSGWTVLCPPDDAFKGYNLTRLYANTETLKSIVMQHLIPSPPRRTTIDMLSAVEGDVLNNNQPLSLDDSATYSTLRSSRSVYGDVVFQKRTEQQEYVVGIKGARGTDGKADWARVLSWGRSTTGGGTGGVIQIDRLLSPYEPSWWNEVGLPSVVGVIGVVIICAFFYGVRMVWRRDTTEATYEPVGGFAQDDDLET